MQKLAGLNIIEALQAQFKDFEAGLNGQSKSPVHAIRRSALESVVTKGLPGPKHEEYKFTNFTRAIERNFDLSSPIPSFGLGKQVVSDSKIHGLDAHKIVFLNGQFSAEYSDDMDVDGLEIQSLEEALKDSPEKVEAIFNSEADFEEDAFVAMNTAFSQQGVLIEIADKAVIEKPIALYFIGDSSKNQLAYNIRNLIVASKFSEATIVEKFDTYGDHRSFTNVVNEFSIGENAHLKYFKIENDTDNAYHISNNHVSQAGLSHFSASTFALNGAMIRNNLNIKLDAEGIETYMNGLYLLDGKTHVDNHTVVDHKKPNCYSNELYKGIMDDDSKGVFNGKIFVRQDAQQTNAFQSNKNILLSNGATVNTKPQLEIWADDVKCSHGCTTGQLDKDALFYLRARGIQKEKARAILLTAFASDVLATISNEAIKEYLEKIITERLEK